MSGLLYFGRLEKEKGFDAIIEMIRFFLKENKQLPFELFVFGEGSLSSEFMDLAQHHKQLHYFGRQELKTIKRYVKNCDYCLMPSNFLETFGLTALTALSRGLPVIGLKKGGLEPFVSDDLDITRCSGKSLGEQLFHCIKKLPHPPKKETFDISSYTKEQWKKNINTLLPPTCKNILLVSDFKNKIGGIETYLWDVKDLLESIGCKVEVFGSKLPRGILGNVIKLAGIGIGIFNFVTAIKLAIKIKKSTPDLIWYHSVLRQIGRFPLWIAGFFKIPSWMMYHDFGYFFPFPSKLTDIHQIKTPLTLKHFLDGISPLHQPLKALFVSLKFLSVWALKQTLRNDISLHLVPSKFMVDIVHKSYHLPTSKIIPLSHFLQD